MSAVSQQAVIRALLIDDDPTITMLLGAFLEGRGYQSESATNGRDALARLAGGCFNLVITDREMPQMDGLELCRALRSLPNASYIYVIMLTSAGKEESLVAAMEAGVDDFLAKPMRPAELGARLRAAERVLALEADLASRNRKLTEAYGQLSRELELASSLQMGQLPAPASFGHWHFDWMFEASSFVGGDVFDYFSLDERYLGFYLADVSGHGVAAAMVAFNAQHQLLAASQSAAAALRESGDLGAAAVATATEYNRRFLQMKDTSLYLTLVFGLVDVQTRTVSLVQAGHPPPLVAADGEPFRPLGEGSLPIGILPQPGYEAHTLTLSPGARLVLYSDGITDCSDPAGQAFGLQRLQKALADQHGAPLNQSCKAVRQHLIDWRQGAFDDDVTLLAVEFR